MPTRFSYESSKTTFHDLNPSCDNLELPGALLIFSRLPKLAYRSPIALKSIIISNLSKNVGMFYINECVPDCHYRYR